ncbi:MAG: ATPase, T2SS/T4P/T4SS family [Planctomycetota bacterium]
MARRLGDILLERGWIEDEALDRALADQKGGRGRLGTLLLGRGLISRDQLGEAFAEQFEVPFRSLTATRIHPQLPRLLPETFARERELAPVEVTEDRVTLAMAAPDDMEAISEVELLTGYCVDPVICLADELTAVLDRAFDERVAARQTAVDIRFEELRTGAANPAAAKTEEDPDAPVVRLVRSILIGAVHSGASDIHLEPHDPQMRVRYRIDGQLQEIMTVPGHSEEAAVGRIKVMADMDTAERRRPQDGTLTLVDGETRASFRVSSIPTVGGEKVVMRVLDETGRTFSFDALGMPDDQVARVRQLLDKPHGMVVMTGPTGSGKTTTMYSMLCSIDSDERNISTIEDPVEFRLPGINQVQANNEFGMGFANGLKYLMRQDPDVILVGEIRDRETATAAVQAALTGHLLISTLHTNDAVGTVARLADLGLDQFKIAGSLIASIGQRLLRRVCPNCRVEQSPERRRANRKLIDLLFEGRERPEEVDPDAIYYEGAGCERCHGTGYVGRVPIYEIMAVTPAMERAIEAGLPGSKLRELAAADGMVELALGGLRQARAGVTTVEEVYFKLAG